MILFLESPTESTTNVFSYVPILKFAHSTYRGDHTVIYEAQFKTKLELIPVASGRQYYFYNNHILDS